MAESEGIERVPVYKSKSLSDLFAAAEVSIRPANYDIASSAVDDFLASLDDPKDKQIVVGTFGLKHGTAQMSSKYLAERTSLSEDEVSARLRRLLQALREQMDAGSGPP